MSDKIHELDVRLSVTESEMSQVTRDLEAHEKVLYGDGTTLGLSAACSKMHDDTERLKKFLLWVGAVVASESSIIGFDILSRI